MLTRHHKFVSETDTEVIVCLIEEKIQKQSNFPLAVTSVAKILKGRNTFAVLTKAGDLLAMKQGSQLIVGRNQKHDECFLSSDTASLLGLATEYMVLDDW